jgi:hypothetical protein
MAAYQRAAGSLAIFLNTQCVVLFNNGAVDVGTAYEDFIKNLQFKLPPM